MKKQNKATTQIIEALNSLGFNVDMVKVKTSDPGGNAYAEVFIKASIAGFSHQDDDQSKQPQ